jgi:hypothetical protein
VEAALAEPRCFPLKKIAPPHPTQKPPCSGRYIKKIASRTNSSEIPPERVQCTHLVSPFLLNAAASEENTHRSLVWISRNTFARPAARSW